MGVLLLMGWAGGCSSVGARAHNLEALHSEDGFHRLEAVLYGDFEWEFRKGIGGLVPGSAIQTQEKPPEKIDDPCEVCLENLVELQGITPSDRYEASLKLQQFARWASECPWALSRERSLKALSREALRLELGAHPPRPLVEEPTGPEELGDALAQLVAALRPALSEGLGIDVATLEAACARLRGLNYDLPGARRATAMVSLLEARTPQAERLFEPLRELHVELQRTTVQRALAAGLEDRAPFERSGSHSGWENPRVRGVAVTACVDGLGPAALGELLARRLNPREPSEVLAALVGAVERNGGLPVASSGLPESERSAWEERWIDGLVALATTHSEGRVRVGAMRALAVVSGGNLTSLREEDWLAWREARRAGAGSGGGSSGAAEGTGTL